jgi:hypothetical protein
MQESKIRLSEKTDQHVKRLRECNSKSAPKHFRAKNWAMDPILAKGGKKYRILSYETLLTLGHPFRLDVLGSRGHSPSDPDEPPAERGRQLRLSLPPRVDGEAASLPAGRHHAATEKTAHTAHSSGAVSD